MNIKEVCNELDSLSLRMLQLIKEYIDMKLKIEDFIKSGTLHLAKSRYIMGNRSVSALQLPSGDSIDITASTTVMCKQSCNDDNLTRVLSRLSISDGNYKDGIVRQRNTKKEICVKSKNTSKGTMASIQDPLKWFGVLVPQDMRQAQCNFNKAIELIIDCVNIQLEILSVEEKYKNYLRRKQQLAVEQ